MAKTRSGRHAERSLSGSSGASVASKLAGHRDKAATTRSLPKRSVMGPWLMPGIFADIIRACHGTAGRSHRSCWTSGARPAPALGSTKRSSSSTPLLLEPLPFDVLTVLAIDLPRSELESLARRLATRGASRASTRDARARAISKRCSRGDETAASRAGPPARSHASPVRSSPKRTGARSSSVRSLHDGEPVGVLVFAARRAGAFERDDEALVRTLLEPFAVALENDRRVHELAQLREAAEADRALAPLAPRARRHRRRRSSAPSAGLRAVMERVEQVARTDAPVLILGETGSGKEVVARAIHARSRRARGPVRPRELRRDPARAGRLRALRPRARQLHRRRRHAQGLVRARRRRHAASSTRSASCRSPRRSACCASCRTARSSASAASSSLHVDVRIVAATHRDLRGDGRAKGASARTSGTGSPSSRSICPPLRERPEDIPALARTSRSRAARRFGLVPLVPSARGPAAAASPTPGPATCASSRR